MAHLPDISSATSCIAMFAPASALQIRSRTSWSVKDVVRLQSYRCNQRLPIHPRCKRFDARKMLPPTTIAIGIIQPQATSAAIFFWVTSGSIPRLPVKASPSLIEPPIVVCHTVPDCSLQFYFRNLVRCSCSCLSPAASSFQLPLGLASFQQSLSLPLNSNADVAAPSNVIFYLPQKTWALVINFPPW